MQHSSIRTVASAWLTVLVSTSCGLPEEDWSDQAPTVSCKLLRRCDPIDFHRDFADLDACVAATDLGMVDGCDYDEDAAKGCRAALRWSCARVGRNYDEVVDRCSAIWSCDTGTVLPGGPGLVD